MSRNYVREFNFKIQQFAQLYNLSTPVRHTTLKETITHKFIFLFLSEAATDSESHFKKIT